MNINMCNICNNNEHYIQKINDITEVQIFEDCVKLCIPDIVFSNNITVHLCSICYEGLKTFNKFRLLCTKNEFYMKEMFQTIKTEIYPEDSGSNNFESICVQNIKEEISEDYQLNEFNDDYFENAGESKKYVPEVKVEIEEQPINVQDDSDSTPNQRNKKKKLRPYICKFCSKAFAAPSLLTIHTRVHTGEKPYKCNVCKKAFAQGSHLTCHMRIHSGDKPYTCSVCNKTFANTGNLNAHVKLHPEWEPYRCEICGRIFTDCSTFNRHVRVHLILRPYVCTVCRRSFAYKTSLERHKLIHSGILFTCTDCGREFSDNTNLKRHKRVHYKPLNIEIK